jgi:hypothetical protein
MATTICPVCSAPTPKDASACPKCGKAIQSGSREVLPIKRVGGKLQAVGVVILATGAIATAIGGWWGPALLFPGIVVLFLGKIW